MASIAKLGHVGLVTPDMERSLWFWSDVVGLEEVQRTGDAVFLRGWGEFEHHSLSLREGPTSIDHIGWRAGTASAWLARHLGFKGREHVKFTTGEHVASWMSVTSLSHDIALVGYPPPRDGRFHHVAYCLDNWQDVLRGLDILTEEGLAVDLGPGRHGISQAFFTYVKDPGSGHRLELFSGGYHVYDPDWESIEWTEADLGEGLVWWGPEYPLGQFPAMDGTTPCAPEPAEVAGV
jgi:catechol 2,3-dioxygenase